MKIWSIANQKGGVGKTTTTITLAGLLQQQNQRVLVVDTDPHASLTTYLNFDSDQLDVTLFDLFGQENLSQSGVRELILKTSIQNLDLLPAHISLATLDRTLGQRSGKGLILTKALRLIEQDYDAVLIDCPPVLGVMMVNALAASDRILIPVQTEFLAMKGLERMIHTLTVMQKSRLHNFKVSIIPTMFDKRTKASLTTFQEIKKSFSDRVWNSAIPIDTKLRDASLHHLPASIYAKHSRGVYAYRTLLFYLERLDQNV